MADQSRKLSEIRMEMSKLLLRNANAVPSSEAAHVALFFANVAWNESVGLDHAREGYRSAWETIEAENPALWDELKSNDIDAMIDELVEYREVASPRRPAADSDLRYPGGEGPRRMGRPRRPWRGLEVGDAALWAGEDGRKRGSHPFSSSDSELVACGGSEAGDQDRSKLGNGLMGC